MEKRKNLHLLFPTIYINGITATKEDLKQLYFDCKRGKTVLVAIDRYTDWGMIDYRTA